MSENESDQKYDAILVTLVFLVVGLAILALTKHVVKIDGDTVFVALLLLPLLIYLAITGNLKEVNIGLISARLMKKSAKEIKDNINEIGKYEEKRSTYLGKLDQILKKESEFSLIYADVDDLRQYSRKRFLKDKSSSGRLKENEIRKQTIDKLDFALADAFCECEIKDANGKDAKYDIFQLIEPDIVMIARDTDLKQAELIKQKAEENFENFLSDKEKEFDGLNVTISFISKAKDEMKGATPRSLDKEAHKGHNRLKEARKRKDT